VNPTAGRVAGVLTAATLLVGLGACAHSTKAAPAPPPPSATGDADAQSRLQKALLTAKELPLGYEAQDGVGEVTAIGCDGIDRLYLAPGATATATVSFNHSLTRSFVNEALSVLPEGAAAGIAAFGAAATKCRTFTGGQSVAYKVTTLTGMPRFGEGSAALRVTTTQREARLVDLVATRVGDIVIVVANADAGKIDPELTRVLVTRAVDKVRANS